LEATPKSFLSSASFVSEELDSREGDCAWRLRLRDAPVHVYILIEFQSEVDRFMALRQSVYLGLFYQQLVKHGALTSDGLLPPVLSVVIYNGKADWSAAREFGELVFEPCGPGDAHLVDLKEFRGMLSERVEEWSRQIESRSEKKGLRAGLKKGRAEGLEKGMETGRREVLLHLLEMKFGPLDARSRSRVHAAGPRTLLRWAERVVTAETLADVFRPLSER